MTTRCVPAGRGPAAVEEKIKRLDDEVAGLARDDGGDSGGGGGGEEGKTTLSWRVNGS